MTLLYVIKTFLVDGYCPSLDQIVKSILFIPYLNEFGLTQPVYGLGWTLNCEMFFYAIFGLSLAFRLNLGLLICSATVVCWVVARSLIPDTGNSHVFISFYGDPIVLFFVAGMGIAVIRLELAKTRVALNPVSSILLASSAVAISVYFVDDVILRSFGCIAAVFVAALEREHYDSAANRFAIFSGDASYSVYLTHSFLLGPLFAVSLRYGLTNVPGLVLTTVGAVLGCALLGSLVHVFIEQRLIAASSRFWSYLGRTANA